MIDCAYIGDSIAIGLHQLETQCEIHARPGASSGFITRNFSGVDVSEYVIISLGSNDPGNPALLDNATTLRRTIHARKVIWILPYNRTAAGDITLVAREFGDSVFDIAPIPSLDGLHPEYKQAHAMVEKVLK
jgi:hypothetical protein